MKKTPKSVHHAVYWTPRILTLALIIFSAVFALNAFNTNYNSVQMIGASLFQLIPSFALLAILLIANHNELAGGIIFILLGIGYLIAMPAFLSSVYLLVSGATFLIATLFIACWILKKKK